MNSFFHDMGVWFQSHYMVLLSFVFWGPVNEIMNASPLAHNSIGQFVWSFIKPKIADKLPPPQ